ncbi:MAG: hypothetical protein ABI571_02515, partial [Actinomycetota bacterium]
MKRSRLLVAVPTLGLLAGACSPTKERQPVSLREVAPPDGELSERIAYVRETGVGTSVLVVQDLVTGDVTELDVPGAFTDSPEWSPDGSRLAYTSADVEERSNSSPPGAPKASIRRGTRTG